MPNTLRSELLPDLKTLSARWLRLTGISLEDADAHRAFCHTVAGCGLVPGDGSPIPRTVVLDWHGCPAISAESLAFFRVVLENLSRRDIRLIVCLPERRDSAQILADCDLAVALPGVEWISEPCSGRRTVYQLCRPVHFTANNREPLSRFLDELSCRLSSHFTNDTKNLLMSAAMEIAQNMFSHAKATNCAASALYVSGKRPPVVQLGFADDGNGIASSLSGNPDHRWASYFHDTTVTESVVRRALTTRDGSSIASEKPSGGLGLLIDDLLRKCRSEIYVRSGTAFIAGDSSRREEWTKSYMDHGVGTQLRVAISVETGG